MKEASSKPTRSTKDPSFRRGMRKCHAPFYMPRLASHLISSFLYIYIDEPGLAVPINAHYSSLLSRLWSNIPAQCPFMIETLTLYCFTAAKPLPKCYHSLRSNYSLRWSGLFWRDRVCPFLGCGSSRLATRWLQWLGHWAPISVYLDDRPQTW